MFYSQPDPRTVRNWLEQGSVAGRIIGISVYIDEENWLRDIDHTGNRIADKILAAA